MSGFRGFGGRFFEVNSCAVCVVYWGMVWRRSSLCSEMEDCLFLFLEFREGILGRERVWLDLRAQSSSRREHFFISDETNPERMGICMWRCFV